MLTEEVCVKDFCKIFGKGRNQKTACFNINFQAKSGEVTGIIGPNGAGKSTTMNMITGFIEPTSGRIIINGKDTTFLKQSRIPYLRRSMGVVFQDFRLLPDKTVYDNVAYAMYIVRATPRHIRRQVPMVLSLVGLSNKAKCYPHELSGGEQQRVALARILAYGPDVILLDEPFSAMDTYLKEQLRMELVNLLHGFDGYSIIVTHDRDEAFQFCDELIVLDKGEIIAKGTTHEIFLHPVDIFLQKLINPRLTHKTTKL